MQFGLAGSVALLWALALVVIGAASGLLWLAAWVFDRAPAWLSRASDWDLRRARRAAVRRVATAPPSRLAEHPLNRAGD